MSSDTESDYHMWDKEEHEQLPHPFPGKKPVECIADEACKDRMNTRWDDYDTVYYNRFHQLTYDPTRLLCLRTLGQMGIRDRVEQAMRNVGMGHIGLRHYSIYQDAACQFLASMYIDFPKKTDANEGKLCFKIQGVHYSITFGEICDVFGFERRGPRYNPLKTLARRSDLWAHIGSGAYSASLKQSLIRHPVLRILARIISYTLLRRNEVGRVHVQEMSLLYYAMGDDIEMEGVKKKHDWNMGALFAHHLVGAKNDVFKGKESKKETIGSLLTPIMRHCQVPLAQFSKRAGDPKQVVLGLTALNYQSIVRETLRYEYMNHDGALCHFKLPNREYTRTDTFEAFDFRPPAALVTVISTTSVLPEAEYQPPICPHRTARPTRPSTSQQRDIPRADAGARYSTSALPDYFELPEQPTFDATPEVHHNYRMERDRRQNKIWRWFASAFTGCRRDQAPFVPSQRVPEQARDDADDDERVDPRASSVDRGAAGRSTEERARETLRVSDDPVRLSDYGNMWTMPHPPSDFYAGTGSSAPFGASDYDRERSRSPRNSD